MSRYIFLFDLDATVTKMEIFPEISKKLGMDGKLNELEQSIKGTQIPYKESFLQKIKLFQSFPVSKVSSLIQEIALNERIVDFIQKNLERCYIITGNLDVWVEGLIKKLGMENNVYSSKALVEEDCIQDVFSILDKGAVISQMLLPYVAVGDGNHDAEMIEGAEIGIGYGGVKEIAPSVLASASHAVYDEIKLVEFLRRLL